MNEGYSGFPKGYEIGKTKFVIITGSVMSGVGKGTFSASLGNILKLYHGLKIAPVKFDGYFNVDAGTLNPYRHGEVFVLDDGTETDLDLGSYERMLNQNNSKDNYLTAGKLFKMIIDKERKGDYLGRDVQIIPHVTGEIKYFLRNLAAKSGADIVLVEVGGTVGDIETSYFLEAMRELAYEEGRSNVCFVNVCYIVQPPSLGEHKSKAAQIGIRTLMQTGIQPDIVICRSHNPVADNIKEKMSVFSNVPVNRVFNMYDFGTIYTIPLFLQDLGIDAEVLKIIGLKSKTTNRDDFGEWKDLAEKFKSAKKEIKIAITGKYTNVHDSYFSIIKAIEHTAPYFGAKAELMWIETTEIKNQDDAKKALKDIDGVIVPGGFGERGVEGKIECVRYCRENNVPYFGLCYGFQMAVIEYARNICNLAGAHTTEVDPKTEHPVICILPEQEEVKGLGGTMRLGGHDVVVKEKSVAHKLYGSAKIRERFRHRYNVNTKYIDQLEKAGLVFSGQAGEKKIMQILELPNHKFFVGTQYHPEFTSKPLEPNPLFRGFVEACVDIREFDNI
ncbi:MAG: CTP synthase [Candidatus Aenigmarchaeota archaeon]|nr:CTP synthase [Candidatus Aenigmarchaeota archaeon]